MLRALLSNPYRRDGNIERPYSYCCMIDIGSIKIKKDGKWFEAVLSEGLWK